VADGYWCDVGDIDEYRRANADILNGKVNLPQPIGEQIWGGVWSGENTEIVARRAQKLKVDYLYQGAKYKLKLAQSLCNELGISLKDVAYIGDDLGDIPLLEQVGLSAAPANAPAYVQSRVDWVMTLQGGEGVFREFVERILEEAGLLEQVVNTYCQKLHP